MCPTRTISWTIQNIDMIDFVALLWKGCLDAVNVHVQRGTAKPHLSMLFIDLVLMVMSLGVQTQDLH